LRDLGREAGDKLFSVAINKVSDKAGCAAHFLRGRPLHRNFDMFIGPHDERYRLHEEGRKRFHASSGRLWPDRAFGSLFAHGCDV